MRDSSKKPTVRNERGLVAYSPTETECSERLGHAQKKIIPAPVRDARKILHALEIRILETFFNNFVHTFRIEQG